MGREATCKCRWAAESAQVKALLETTGIILRGELRKRIPFAEMRDVEARAGKLCFTVAGQPVSLAIGAEMAAKWAAAIRNPPSLAKKLGITAKSVVQLIGDNDDKALRAALAEAAQISAKDATVIVACVHTSTSLLEALAQSRAATQNGVPLWLVYLKGPGHPLNENLIRKIVLPTGLVDSKVAAVSAQFTAIRFNRRKA